MATQSSKVAGRPSGPPRPEAEGPRRRTPSPRPEVPEEGQDEEGKLEKADRQKNETGRKQITAAPKATVIFVEEQEEVSIRLQRLSQSILSITSLVDRRVMSQPQYQIISESTTFVRFEKSKREA